jgi:hypothetical protein
MTRKQSTQEPPNQEHSMSDEEFLRYVALAVEKSPQKDATLVDLLETMRREMKGVRH